MHKSREHEEECRACTSFKSFMKLGQNIKPSHQCPLDKDDLGRNTWSLLHTMAAYYPNRPTNQQKIDMDNFIRLLSKFYPCSYCAEDMRKDISDDPPVVDTRESLSKWLCDLHNKVNNKLGKAIFDCSKVDERWFKGPPDGSCAYK